MQSWFKGFKITNYDLRRPINTGWDDLKITICDLKMGERRALVHQRIGERFVVADAECQRPDRSAGVVLLFFRK